MLFNADINYSCDKESSSHLVMSEIFDSLIMYTGTLYGTYNKAWGDGAIFICTMALNWIN